MGRITIGFSTPKKFKATSQLIKLYEGTNFSHCFISLPPNNKTPFRRLYHASHGDVHCLKYGKFKKENNIIHEYKINIEEFKIVEIEEFLWNQLQKPYSITQILQIAFNLQLSKNKNNAFICTEIVAKIVKKYLDENIRDLDFLGLKELKGIIDERFNTSIWFSRTKL